MIWYMIWYGIVWYGMIEYMIWYGMVWYMIWLYDMVRYGMVWYDIWYDMICYDIFNCNWVVTRWHSTVHIYTQKIHGTTQITTEQHK